MDIGTLVTSRQSCRAYFEKPVADALVREILQEASWAPSGCNLQPWHVYVVKGAKITALYEAIFAKMMDMQGGLSQGEGADFEFLPDPMPKKSRMRQVDAAIRLYEAIGVERKDKSARLQAAADNFRFFGAPVGMIFTIKKGMTSGQFMDIGMFIQNIMLLAEGKGLNSCAQEAWAVWSKTVHDVLDVPDDEMIVCGLALGYGDKAAAANSFRTTRESVDNFTKWCA